MIPIEKLEQVGTLVVHGNCPDGMASALVLDDILPGREIIFAIHNITPLEARPGLLFCDFCPPRERVGEFRAAGTIVLDHHRTQQDVIESFEYHAFGDERLDPGVSGAVLAYRHVWAPIYQALRNGCASLAFPQALDELQPTVVEDFAVLAGIRDTWQRQSELWTRACEQTEAMLFYPQSYWLQPALRPEMLRARNLELLMERFRVGSVALDKRLESSKRLAEHAFYFKTTKGTEVAILPARHVSDAADMVQESTQLVIGFSYTVEQGEIKMLLSTRSRNGYDCSKFCQYYGGGGHTAAAGCQVPTLSNSPNPYAVVSFMLETFELADEKAA